MPGYLVWLASMMLVVYTALWADRTAEVLPAGARATRTHRLVDHRVIIGGMAVVLPLLFTVLLMLLSARGAYSLIPVLDDTDQNTFAYTGEEAERRILQRARSASPPDDKAGEPLASANKFWLYDGGNFGGSITYWMFQCDGREDCLQAVEYLGHIRRAELKPWAPSHYAVVMEGPDYYAKDLAPSKKLRHNPWNVRGMTNGLVHELLGRDQSTLEYYAIDLDRNCVYHHYESGGFPLNAYDAR